MKRFNYGERCDMLEEALTKWADSFQSKLDQKTAGLVAFSGAYFDHGGPPEMFQGPFSPRPVIKRMRRAVARIAQKHKVCALRYLGENCDNIPKRYLRKLPIG